MTPTREHWFLIEQVMTDVHALLEQARADAQMLSTWPAATEDLVPAISSSVAAAWRAAPDQRVTRMDFLPPEVQALRAQGRRELHEPLFGRPLQPSEASAPASPSSPPSPSNARNDPPEPVTEAGGMVGTLRAKLRERLTWLRSQLADSLSAREAYHVLFPIVIHVDELTGAALGPHAADWRPLQVEFFDIDDGGELFFQKADELLAKEDTHPLIFEVFYFCLDDGFVGRFGGASNKLQDYKNRLTAQIPTEAPPASFEQTEASPVHLTEFPKRLYLIAAGSVVATFILFQILSALEAGPG